MKRNDVVHQISFKLLYVFSGPLTTHKLLPRFKEIFNGNDILICTSKLHFLFITLQHKKSYYDAPPPARILPLLQKMKEVYLVWYGYYQILPKLHRHSLGQRIDTLFVETIEAIAIASFLSQTEKHPWVKLAVRKVDTLKILLMVLWETKSMDDKKYIALSLKVEEAGRMLGGWNGQLSKQNSPTKAGEK